MTAPTRRAIIGTGQVTNAAYIAWTSAKAHPEPPKVQGELTVPFGDGWLHVAREWTVPAIVELNEELSRSGETDISSTEIQSPPNLTSGYPKVERCGRVGDLGH